ncbi:hypothetical protein BKI52_43055 [marine bacterium AO1-C]|nr:hypothetical protein BKI52_43055 [marine bacterium AO1-C]
MFTPKIRFVLIALATVALVISLTSQNIPSAILYGVVSVALFAGYYRNGTVWLAYQQLRRQNYDKAIAYLNQTKYPGRLAKSQKGYYHFIKGFAAIEEEQFEQAKDEFQQALEAGLRTQNEEAITYLQLTDISLIFDDKAQAQQYLDKIQTLKYKPSLEEALVQVKEKMETI